MKSFPSVSRLRSEKETHAMKIYDCTKCTARKLDSLRHPMVHGDLYPVCTNLVWNFHTKQIGLITDTDSRTPYVPPACAVAHGFVELNETQRKARDQGGKTKVQAISPRRENCRNSETVLLSLIVA